MASIAEEIRILVERLSPTYQRRVLEFAQELDRVYHVIPHSQPSQLPPSVPGKALLGFKLPKEDVEAMERALDDCEEVVQDES